MTYSISHQITIPDDGGPTTIGSSSPAIVPAATDVNRMLSVTNNALKAAKAIQSSNVSRPAAGFPRFNLLVTELRFKVWKFALPKPQVIEFYSGYHIHHNCRTTRPAHVDLLGLLLTCRESYRYITPFYNHITLDSTSIKVERGSPLLVDFQTDIPYFMDCNSLFAALRLASPTQDIRLPMFATLAMDGNHLQMLLQRNKKPDGMELLAQLTNLQTLMVVGQYERGELGNDHRFVRTDEEFWCNEETSNLWEYKSKTAGLKVRLVWVKIVREGTRHISDCCMCAVMTSQSSRRGATRRLMTDPDLY
jgi:hypothetical protein